MDRRTTIKWVVSAALAMQTRLEVVASAAQVAVPYGTDPKLLRAYEPGELWPLSFTAAERRLAQRLCDTIIPEDAHSPSASKLGVVEFIDEWISAPYATQRADRIRIKPGLRWLDQESRRRFKRGFVSLEESQVRAICDDICYELRAKPRFAEAARFFARFRDLTAAGYYTTPAGRDDLKYVGNVPAVNFAGPPLEVLKKVGLA